MIAACSRAAAPNDCVTAETRTVESPLGVAIVRREGDRARIELGLRGVVSAEWSTRDLVFQPGDDELERYRAIGFAIGTLVARAAEPAAPQPQAQAEAPEPVAPQPSEVPPAVERSTPPAPAPAPRTRATWLDLSGGVGLGLIPGPPRAGATLRAASELVAGGLFGAAETGYAERAGGDSLRVRWLSLALGVGHPLLPTRGALAVDARLMGTFERLSFAASEGTVSDGAARWKPGVAVAVDASWAAAGPLGVVLGASTQLDPKRTVVKVSGTQAGETPALGFNGFVGLRLRLR